MNVRQNDYGRMELIKNNGRMELIKYANRNCPSRINDGYNDNYSTDKCNPDIANGDHTLTFYWGDNDKLWDLSYMFEGKDTIIEVSLFNLTPENIQYMNAMFKNCKNLKKVHQLFLNKFFLLKIHLN